jgi:lycopene cyclase domain-containing protein
VTIIDHLHYLGVLAACLVGTLPLEWLGSGVYRRPRRLVRTLAVPLALFLVWDAVAIGRGHWWFDPRQTTGLRLGPVPIEEALFFVVVPLCALLTLEAVQGLVTRLARRTRATRPRVPVSGGANDA